MIATMSIEKSIIIDSDSYVVIASPPYGDEPNSRYLTPEGRYHTQWKMIFVISIPI